MARFRVLALGVALAFTAVSTGALGEDKQEAKERFEKGVVLFKDGNFGAALVEFRAAYEAMPHFSVRYNLGISLYNLHRYAEAKEEFIAFLDEGGDGVDKKKRKEVEGILAELDSLVSTLQIVCNVDGAKLFLNGTFEKDLELTNNLLLDVGEYDVEIRKGGYQSFYDKLEVPGGKIIKLEVDLEVDLVGDPDDPGEAIEPPVEPVEPVTPHEDGKGRSPAAFWSVLGLTLASGVTAGALGGTFLAKKKDFENAGAVEGWKDDRDELKSLALGADVMYGVTGALAVATVVIAVVTFRKEEKAEEPPKVTMAPTGTGLVLGGTF